MRSQIQPPSPRPRVSDEIHARMRKNEGARLENSNFAMIPSHCVYRDIGARANISPTHSNYNSQSTPHPVLLLERKKRIDDQKQITYQVSKDHVTRL